MNANFTFNKLCSDEQVALRKIREPIIYNLAGYSPVEELKREKFASVFPGKRSIHSLSEIDGPNKKFGTYKKFTTEEILWMKVPS